MKSRRALLSLVVAFLFVVPAPAYAADGIQVVPGWLSIVVAGVGLLTSVVLLVDAVLLRRVAEGSVVAENIQYMMLAVVVFGVSTLARWAATMTDDAISTVQITFTADLLVIAGMALLAVYFYRVRAALTRYLSVLSASLDSAPDASGADVTDGSGEDVDG